jgi:hypothetical protein
VVTQINDVDDVDDYGTLGQTGSISRSNLEVAALRREQCHGR